MLTFFGGEGLSTTLRRCILDTLRRCISGGHVYVWVLIWKFTPRKINMEPKNGGLEDDFPFQLGDVWVLC